MVNLRVGIECEKIKCAEFEMWFPPKVVDKVVKPRAVVVLVPGSNGDGRNMVDWKGWQEFANETDTALIGCCFQDKNPTGIEGYCKAAEESGPALLWSLREYSDRMKMDLEHIPLLIWGFSAGGQFSYEMNAAFPERVGGFVVNKGGIYYSSLVSELARKTPGLFFIGQKDDQWRQDVVHGLIAVNRRGGAKWVLVQEKVGHDVGMSEGLGQKFFRGLIKSWGE